MSVRIYECRTCKSAIYINDVDDDLKPKICEKCNSQLVFLGSVGTRV